MTNEKETAQIEENVVKLRNDANLMLFKAEEVANITDVSQEARAVEFVAQIKLRYKMADKELDSYIDPLKDTIKRLKGRFEPILSPLLEAEKIIKAGMVKFRNAEDFKRREEERREAEKVARRAKLHLLSTNDPEALEKVKEAGEDLTAARQLAPKSVAGQSGTAVFVKKWKGEIVDYTKLPDWFITEVMDLAKEKGLFDQVMRSVIARGVHTIDGVRTWEESTPRFNT